MDNGKKARKQPVDKSVDNFAISVDKSAKPVDNFVDNFWAKKVIHRKTDLSTGYPQTYPQAKLVETIDKKQQKKVIHRKRPW